jgi:hypothetical protein
VRAKLKEAILYMDRKPEIVKSITGPSVDFGGYWQRIFANLDQDQL